MPTSEYIAQQVAELVRRGMDEARHGNRAAAAALLRRAVQLDPQHEAAWLWLGGYTAEPDEAAFALRAALQLNPDNQSASRGLRELEASGRLSSPAPQPPAGHVPDGRWQRWRESRSAARSFAALLWALPVVLLAATVGMRLTLTLQPPAAVSLPPAAPRVAKSAPTAVALPTPQATPLPPATPVPRATQLSLPTGTPRQAMLAYLAAMEQARQPLRAATEGYLNGSERRITAERAAATRTLRDTVQHAHEHLSGIAPPAEARDAHQLYLDGLAREIEALDDTLAFYVEYNLARSNSAALRMQQARAAIDAAARQLNALAERYEIGSER